MPNKNASLFSTDILQEQAKAGESIYILMKKTSETLKQDMSFSQSSSESCLIDTSTSMYRYVFQVRSISTTYRFWVEEENLLNIIFQIFVVQ